MTFGADRSGWSAAGGSVEKTSTAAPASRALRQRLGERVLVDDPAPRDVDDERVRLHQRELLASDRVPRVSRVNGTCTVTASAAARISGRGRLRMPCSAAASGGHERVVPDDLHPERPGTVGHGHPDLPEADDAESPPLELATDEVAALPLAAVHRRIRRRDPPRQREEQRERVLGRGDRVAGRGVDDDDAGRGRGGQVDVVDPDPGAPDDDEAPTGGDGLGIDLDLAPDEEPVVPGQAGQQLVAREADPDVDLVVRAEQVDALLGDGLRHEDAHGQALVPTGVASWPELPTARSAAARAAGSATPAWTAIPSPGATSSSTLRAETIVVDLDVAEVPDPEDPPGQPTLAAGEHEAAVAERAREVAPRHVGGHVRGRDRVRGMGRVGEQVEAHRLEAGARRRPAGRVPREDPLVALGRDELERRLELEAEPDRGRPGRLAFREALAVLVEVEVEARHRRALGRGPGAVRDGDHREARRDHPRLLRPGHDDVEAPAVHVERQRAEPADGVDDEKRVGRLRADDRGEVGQGIRHARSRSR